MKNKVFFVVAWVLAVVVLAVVVTSDMPSRRQYEVLYEFRVHNYVKNVVGPERMLSGISNRDSQWLRDYLNGKTVPEGLKRDLKYDKTEKLTLIVRGNDSIQVSNYGVEMYRDACDTITHYGEEMCRQMAVVLRREIEELPEIVNDSMQALQKELYDKLTVLTTESAG